MTDKTSPTGRFLLAIAKGADFGTLDVTMMLFASNIAADFLATVTIPGCCVNTIVM